jgi:NAD-dependent deacetylase
MKNIVILTGAGISAESGIHTYRDTDGLWTKYNPMEVSHINGWKKNPQKVLDFKNELRRQFEAGKYQPNAAHHALTRLQNEWKHGEVTLVTQNIDGLHRDAGSIVFEMHGNGREKFCMKCGHKSPFDADIVLNDPCAKCGVPAQTRPYVVMFGEMPCFVDVIEQKLDHCHIFAMIGSSGDVMPANTFVVLANDAGADTYLVNVETIAHGGQYKHHYIGPATTEVPKFVEDLLKS